MTYIGAMNGCSYMDQSLSLVTRSMACATLNSIIRLQLVSVRDLPKLSCSERKKDRENSRF